MADGELEDIRRLLDEFDGTNADEPLVDRVADVIDGFNRWADLAVRRLHEIHVLTGEECDACRPPESA